MSFSTEIIAERADADKPHMGLTSWTGARPIQADAEVAKNYLNADELETLNRIVVIYLDFAELQAMNRRPMYMRDWVAKLDEFLRISEREILTHAGSITHEEAVERVREVYEKYRKQVLEDSTPVERHFVEAVREVKELEKRREPRNTQKTRRGKNRG